MIQTSLDINPAERNMKNFGLAIILFVACIFSAGMASAQDNLPSEKTVKFLTKLAFSKVPGETKSDGKVVKIDKSKPEQILIPVDEARRVIKIGSNTAKAQLCGEKAYVEANYKTLMRSETGSKKWTPGQLEFIHKLHLMTVVIQTGDLKKGGASDEKLAETLKEQAADKDKCPKAELESVKKAIEAYVASNKG